MPRLLLGVLLSIVVLAPGARAGTLVFEENRGQAGQLADFAARADGFTVRLEATGIELLREDGARAGLRFVGAREATLEGLDPLSERVRYYDGSGRREPLDDVRTFAGVGYRGLHPGVDLSVSAGHDRLVLELVLAPGVEASEVAFLVEGELEVTTASPGVSVVRRGDVLGVEGAAREIVLDVAPPRGAPGSSSEIASLATASDGSMCVAGRSITSGFGDSEAFVACFAPDGTTRRFTTWLGGAGDDVPLALEIEASGEVVVSGERPSGEERFVARVAPDGELLSVGRGGGGETARRLVALDARGNRFASDGARSIVRTDAATGAIEERRIAIERELGIRVTDLEVAPDGRVFVAAILHGDETGGLTLVEPAAGGGLIVAGPVFAAASCPGTIFFDGGAGTNLWQTATNWSTDVLPGAADDVCIPAGRTVTLSSGTHSIATLFVESGASLTISTSTTSLSIGGASDIDGSFSLTGGTLQSAAALTIDGSCAWGGGAMTGAGTTQVASGIAISGTGVKDLTGGRILETSGTTTWAGTGSIRAGSSTAIRNFGTWDAQANTTMSLLSSPTVFENRAGATFKKSAGTGTTTIDIAFDNAGTVDVQSGTINLSAAGNGTGAFNGSAGTTLRFGGGAHVLSAASSIDVGTLSLTTGSLDVSGACSADATTISGGTLTFEAAATLATLGSSLSITAGTLTLTSGEDVALGTLTQSGGTLAGTDDVTVSGLVTWSGGTMSGAATTSAGGDIAISGNAVKDLTNGRTLDAAGSVTWTGTGTIRLGLSTIRNAGTWTAQSDAQITTLTGSPLFENLTGATFRKTTGTGTTTFAVPYTGAGAIDVQSGTLSFTAGGTFPGAITGASGTTLRFAGGTCALPSGSSVAAAAVSVIGGGTAVDVHGSFSASNSTTITAGSLTFHTDATVAALGTALTVGGGTLTLDSGEDFNLSTLTLSNGVIQGSDDVTVSGTTSWSGGEMTGAGTTSATGGVAFGNNSVKDLTGGRTLATAGTSTWSGTGSIRVGTGATIRNSGTWEVMADAGITLIGNPPASFENLAGATFRKSAGTLVTSVNVPLTNAGTLEVQTGTLSLDGGGTNGGSILGAPGTTLRFAGGDHVMTGGSSVAAASVAITFGSLAVHGAYSASGTSISGGSATFHADSTVTNLGNDLAVSVGTLTLDSGEPLGVTTLTLSSGVLQGSDTLTISGTTTWSGGEMTGAGLTNASGGIAISNNAVKDLTGGRELDTAGTTTWTGTGTVRVGSGAAIHNAGTWDAQTNASMAVLGGAALFENAAGSTFRKSSTGTTSIDVPFANDGAVEIATAGTTLAFGGAVSGSGSIAGAAGTTLAFNGGSHSLGAGSSVTVPTVSVTAGTVDVHGSYAASAATNVTGGTLTLHPDATLASLGSAVTIDVGTLDLASGETASATTLAITGGGTLQASDALSVSGLTTWTAGTMAGSGTTSAGGGIAFSGSPVKDLVGTRRLEVAGSTTWTGTGSIRLGPGAVIHNTGDWDAQSTAALAPLPTGGLFENAAGGTFRKSVGTGATSIQVPFTNAGAVRGQIGTLAFSGGYTQSAGSIRVEGGTITSTSALDIQGGIVGGSGTIGAVVTNGGTLAAGLSPGGVTISGSLTQSAGATLDVELGGLTPVTTHDRVAVSGAATIAGTLHVSIVNGFVPHHLDTFTILTFGSASGTFSTLDVPDLGGDLGWKVHYNPTSVVLEVDADLDGDEVDNSVDCAPEDPTAWAVPAQVAGARFGADHATLSWTSLAAQAGPAVVYDVLRGALAQLPGGVGSGAAETCLATGTPTAQITDSSIPVPAAAYYYLVRGSHVCGDGTWGSPSSGPPYSPTACP
jgi:hypothetical protein